MEFRGMKTDMMEIQQRKITPGPDPPLPDYLKSHAEQHDIKTADYTTQKSAQSAYPIAANTIDTCSSVTGFIRVDPKRKDYAHAPSTNILQWHRHGVDLNLWDAENFSSLDPKLPIYKREAAFLSFQK